MRSYISERLVRSPFVFPAFGSFGLSPFVQQKVRVKINTKQFRVRNQEALSGHPTRLLSSVDYWMVFYSSTNATNDVDEIDL